jgi:nitroimidazol reductase NimA-like FMN-containing flavoprotein (pyridoxamine 5'-phosphate oxidase superfamily)
LAGVEHLVEMDQSECFRLLEQHVLGRVAVVVNGYPVVFPVNYALVGGAILLCLRRGGDLDRATSDSAASLEIDGEDSVYHEGWSVLAVGRTTHLPPSAELGHEMQQLAPSSWAGGERSLFVRLAIDGITGRRIRRRAG